MSQKQPLKTKVLHFKVCIILYKYVLPHYYFYLQNTVHRESISKYEKEGVKESGPKEEIIQGYIYSENANNFNKVLANWIQKYIKEIRYHNQVRFILGMKE